MIPLNIEKAMNLNSMQDAFRLSDEEIEQFLKEYWSTTDFGFSGEYDGEKFTKKKVLTSQQIICLTHKKVNRYHRNTERVSTGIHTKAAEQAARTS